MISQRQVRKTPRPASLRPSLKPGQVLIILAGRFRGKRVILLDHLQQGVLLVTGPFKINGVPIRRVNARYVIATSTSVNVSGIDKDLLKKLSDSKYWAREKSEKKKGEDAFFKQGEKAEVCIDVIPSTFDDFDGLMCAQKKEISKSRVEDQKSLDKVLISEVKKQPMLASYLAASFSLRKGDKPHEMTF
jgi:large subunit ribosomal protein L6e